MTKSLQPKNNRKKRLILAAAVLAVLAISFFALYRAVSLQLKARELSEHISLFGWQDYVDYSMLSKELKEIISEEEFADSSSEGRMAMYRKLEGLLIYDKPANSFDGSTADWKSPYFETYELGGISYWVDFRIDLDAKLNGDIEAVNFSCYIREINKN